MLTIRLQRAGKKNKPEYRVVLAEKTAASQKKFTEVLGSYNPHTKALQIRNQDRLNYWIDEQHVEVSPTVNNLLITKEVIKGNKSKAFTIPKKEVVAEETSEAPAEAASTDSEAPAETTTEAPAETSVPEESAPAEAPAPAESEAPVETPAETPSETPAETPVQE